MNIILLITSLGTGGAEFSTLTFYGWLKNNTNFNIKIMCLKKADPSYDLNQFGFEEVHYLDKESFWSKVKEFNEVIDSFNPQIVHSVLFDANLIGRFSRIQKRSFKHMESLVNQTYSIHRLNDPNINRLKLEGYRFIDFITQIYGVDHYHSNGKTVADHYQKKLLITPSRITNIPRGRDFNPFLNRQDLISGFRNNLNLDNKVVLINVARHEYQKAQTVLLEALNQIKHLDKKYILLLVGRNGESTQLIKNNISEYGLHDNVKILGHRSDVPKLLAASDIFVFPSRFEGLPGALIEAEAASLPIICTNIKNNCEVVEEYKNALLFPVDDAKILSRQLENLILDADKRKLMGSESYRIFQKKFTINSVHEKMLKLLERLRNN